MTGLKKTLARMPGWILSGFTTLAILWLTLAPKPLGEKPPPLFPGADKLAHAIMFGGLAVMILLDWQRKHEWERIGWPKTVACAIAVSIFGIIIEITQAAMGLGRGFEYGDILADTTGAFFFPFIYLFFQNFWTSTYNK